VAAQHNVVSLHERHHSTLPHSTLDFLSHPSLLSASFFLALLVVAGGIVTICCSPLRQKVVLGKVENNQTSARHTHGTINLQSESAPTTLMMITTIATSIAAVTSAIVEVELVAELK